MKAIDAHEAEGVVDASGSVHVGNLPFPAGDHVRILVLREAEAGPRRHMAGELEQSRVIRQGLQGSVLRYEGPDEPVAAEDWEALNEESED